MPPKRPSNGPMFIVKGPVYSDGDASHRPEQGSLTRANEDGYLQTLAERWMKEESRTAQPGDLNIISQTDRIRICGLGVREFLIISIRVDLRFSSN
ncbi:MAG: hypothetical protein Q9172_004186 [Xanthocarpia lactea]